MSICLNSKSFRFRVIYFKPTALKKERQKKYSFDAQIYLFFINYSPYEAAIN